ncbi:hypothetical protein JCM1840_000713 [Sporobolomyces johnsonii]
MRRLIVCCDGTWQSALYQTDSSMLTNISRLYTAIERRDTANDSPVEQLKLYLPGVGTGEELAVGIVAGAMGDGLMEKVREAYYWLAQNYEQGDEIHLYGFSRGAYICRLLGSFISVVGILDPKSNLSRFPSIFSALCRARAPSSRKGRKHARKLQNLLDQIKPSREEQLRGYKGGFLIKVLALFDTVPLYHFRHLAPDDTLLPHQNPFGLSDEELEPQIEIALQALSISENRPAYTPIILRRGEVVPGQKLLQIWFAGCHTDVGGGYPQHDLSDLSLNWLVSQVQEYLALDLSYISNLSARPAAPWGQLKPHHGFGHSLHAHDRPLPHGSEHHTQQYYHASILEQSPLSLPRKLRPLLEDPEHPLFFPLTPFEQKRKNTWPTSSAPPSPVPAPPKSRSLASSKPASPANVPISPFHPGFRPAASSPPVVSSSFASSSTTITYSPSSHRTHVHLTSLRQTRIVRTLSGLVQDVEVERAKMRAAGDSPGEAHTR